MELSEARLRGLNVALEEAILLGFEVHPPLRAANATFKVWTLPVDGPCPDDRRVQLLFHPVGRVGAAPRGVLSA